MTPQDEYRKRARSHIIAFLAVLALALLSAATVLSDGSAPTAVFLIAVVQVAIVLTAMMHILREGPWVKGLVVFCAVNAVGLAVSLYISYFDTIEGTDYVVVAAPASVDGAGAEPSGEDH